MSGVSQKVLSLPAKCLAPPLSVQKSRWAPGRAIFTLIFEFFYKKETGSRTVLVAATNYRVRLHTAENRNSEKKLITRQTMKMCLKFLILHKNMASFIAFGRLKRHRNTAFILDAHGPRHEAT